MKAIGYIRVSTDKQERANQKAKINEAAAREGLKLSGIIEETISSRKADREIYSVIESLQPGETLIVTELSRLARSIGQVFDIVEKIKTKGAKLWVLNPEIRTGNGNDLLADMLLFALSTAAQLERDLISERTKNGLAARKAQGVRLGRPPGRGGKVKAALEAKGLKASEIKEYYNKEIMTAAAIARLLGLSRPTVNAWLKQQK
jgi:DNA invertase Pin-like site-specific DNA recombinase